MNKNVLVLSSSPRRGGNSDLLATSYIGSERVRSSGRKIFMKDKRSITVPGAGQALMEKKLPQKMTWPRFWRK